MRGRRDYAHPTQLCAMVHFGFVGEKSAAGELTPTAIPAAQEALFLDAEPGSALAAVEKFDWAKPPKYFMFARKIKSWSSATAVKDDLKKFRPSREAGACGALSMTADPKRIDELERDVETATQRRDAAGLAARRAGSSRIPSRSERFAAGPRAAKRVSTTTSGCGSWPSGRWRFWVARPSRRC